MGGNGDIRLAKRNKPTSIVKQSDWDFLCDYFASDEMKRRLLYRMRLKSSFTIEIYADILKLHS
ncbi:Hypothetical predicted protein [Olea europaea subsp. europaea]|nr:Hypothetical predicted protein [Olea europaea subsp. europaea]